MKALLLSLSMLVSATVAADTCSTWSLVPAPYSAYPDANGYILIARCPNGDVNYCAAKPECYPSHNTPVAVFGPGESAPTGFWNDYGSCPAIDHAVAYSCPVNYTPDPYGGPDTQTP